MPGQEQPPNKKKAYVGLGALLFVSPILASLANTPPESVWDFVFILGGATLGAVSVAFAYRVDQGAEHSRPGGEDTGPAPVPTPEPTPEPPPGPAPGGGHWPLARFGQWLGGALGWWGHVVAAVLVVAVFAVFAGPPLVQWVRNTWYGCPSPTQLRVAAGPEVVEVSRMLGREYEDSTSRRAGDCPEASVFVYEADSDEVAARLADREAWSVRSTDAGALLDIGPQPDLWLTGPVAGIPPVGTGAVEDARRIATSPVVIGVPPGSALGDETGPEPRTWTEAIDAVEDDDLGLVAPDLRTTTTGRLLAALTTASSPFDDDRDRLTQLERQVIQTSNEGGFPVGGTDGLLCRLREAGAPTGVGVVATELDLVRANRGDAFGDTCGRVDAPPPLRAVYPTGESTFDVQLVRTAWTEQGERQRTAAADFADWVSSQGGASTIRGAGLRPEGSALLPSAPGLDPPRLRGRPPVDDQELTDAQGLLDQIQLRGRILFAVDTSGSMAAATPGGTRLESAARAVSATLPLAREGRDELGLWLFPDASDTAPRRVVELGPVGGTRDRAEAELSEVRPSGNTPLFRTMVDGIAAVDSADAAATDVLVVITDGEDTTSGIDVAAVVAATRPDVRLVVVPIGEIRCDSAQLGALTGSGRSVECRDADPATLPTVLTDVVQPYWSGR